MFERFDVLALPVTQVWPFPVGERWPERVAGRAMDTYHRWMEVAIYATFAGLPAISVPAGFHANGRWPAGLSLPGHERLARSGVTFTNHQCPATMCTSSRSVIVTGPSSSGSTAEPLPPWSTSAASMSSICSFGPRHTPRTEGLLLRAARVTVFSTGFAEK